MEPYQLVIGNLSKYQAELDEKLKKSSELTQRKQRMLSDFFEQRPSSDICVILDGAVDYISTLAKHMTLDNVLLYRPKNSPTNQIEKALLYGRPHPERPILLFDDMVMGINLRGTSDHFQNLGYSRDKIFTFLEKGIRAATNPVLMQVDMLL